MPDTAEQKPIDLIKSIAEQKRVLLDDKKVECLCFVYGHVLSEIGKRLELTVTNKISMQEMENALDTIHSKLNHLKVSGKINEDDQRYSDIDCISPILEIVIAQLRATIEIHDDTLPDPRRRPERLRIRNDALVFYNQGLLACRRYMIEINQYAQFWSDEAQTEGCQDLRATG
jgi:hypothetical protein